MLFVSQASISCRWAKWSDSKPISILHNLWDFAVWAGKSEWFLVEWNRSTLHGRVPQVGERVNSELGSCDIGIDRSSCFVCFNQGEHTETEDCKENCQGPESASVCNESESKTQIWIWVIIKIRGCLSPDGLFGHLVFLVSFCLFISHLLLKLKNLSSLWGLCIIHGVCCWLVFHQGLLMVSIWIKVSPHLADNSYTEASYRERNLSPSMLDRMKLFNQNLCQSDL